MKKLALIALNVLVIIGLAIFGGYYYQKYQNLKKNPPSADQIAQQQIDKTLAEVGKLYQLPKDEKPSVATVKDVNKLKDQPFFDKAQNGDITLIYSNAKLAILYRPSNRQIINVSSVSIQNNPVVKVYGPGRQAAESKLTAAKITFADGGESKAVPVAVIVVDLSGANAEQARKIADALGGQVGQLPAGEDKPSGVDIAVYVP